MRQAYSNSGRFLAGERAAAECPANVLSRQPAAARASSAAECVATASGLKRTSKGLRTGLRPVRASPLGVDRIAGCGACCEGPSGCSRSRSVAIGNGASAASMSSRGAVFNCAATTHTASAHDINRDEEGRICRPPKWGSDRLKWSTGENGTRDGASPQGLSDRSGPEGVRRKCRSLKTGFPRREHGRSWGVGSGPKPRTRIDDSLSRNPVFARAPENPVSDRFSEQHVLQLTSRAGTGRDLEETGFLGADIRNARPFDHQRCLGIAAGVAGVVCCLSRSDTLR